MYSSGAIKEGTKISTIEKSIDVNVPARTAYNQWTQFEEFPRFMDSVLEGRQLDDEYLHWRTNIGGKEKDFDAEITEQIPNKRIAWRSRSGAPNAGVVTFHPLNDQNTRIMLQMEYEPEGIIEKGGDILGVASRRIEGDLSDSKNTSSQRAVRGAPGAEQSTDLLEGCALNSPNRADGSISAAEQSA